MDRRRFLQVSSAAMGGALVAPSSGWAGIAGPPSIEQRGLVIYLDQRLGRATERLHQKIVSAMDSSPLLQALSGGGRAGLLPADAQHSADQPELLAYNHVLLIGFADDALLQRAWQREARFVNDSAYVFGFGCFQASLGYIESDRNPFLHASSIPTAPFETELIAITGTDLAGIELAVQAFLEQGLANGLVAVRGWKRPATTLLDRDPLLPSFTLPAALPASLGALKRIAISQAGEDEYRGVLADAKVKPDSIWRGKYYQPGEWDAPGLVSAFHNYAAGLHRRAYGNTIWVGTFASQDLAMQAAPRIAAAASLAGNGSRWTGGLPPYAWGLAAQGDAPSPGTVELWVDGTSVVIATRTARAISG